MSMRCIASGAVGFLCLLVLGGPAQSASFDQPASSAISGPESASGLLPQDFLPDLAQGLGNTGEPVQLAFFTERQRRWFFAQLAALQEAIKNGLDTAGNKLKDWWEENAEESVENATNEGEENNEGGGKPNCACGSCLANPCTHNPCPGACGG